MLGAGMLGAGYWLWWSPAPGGQQVLANSNQYQQTTLRCRPQSVDEKFHHPLLVHARVAAVGTDLDIKALAGVLQRLDQLQRVRRMDVVVGGAVVEQQAPLQRLRIRQRAAGVVAVLVLLRDPHVALGKDRVVGVPVG